MKPTLLALLIAAVAFFGALYTAFDVYDAMPHIEDEMAFLWQARVIASGRLALPTPQPCPDCFLVPFVVDHGGLRFGKYPLGWPVLLALGERAGARAWVNPLLTALTVWLIYRLGRKLFDAPTALLAALLAALSPFVWMNGGSLLSHPWSLLLAVIFCLGWLDAFTAPNPALPPRLARALPLVTAALALGLLALTRPLTAVGVALPFAAHGLWLLLRGGADVRRRLAGFVAIAGALAAVHFLWQYAVTGDALLNPYLLWWPYDTVGFGPGVGLQPGGYLPEHAWANIAVSLHAGASDLFGWPGLSWLFLLPGLWAVVRHPGARHPGGLLIAALLPALVLAYALYWIGSWVYGPRYYYEALLSPVLLTAVGIRWLAGRGAGIAEARSAEAGAAEAGAAEGGPAEAGPGAPVLQSTAAPAADPPAKGAPSTGLRAGRFHRLRPWLTAALVAALVGGNLFFYLPRRLDEMRGLYGFSAECLRPFQTHAARMAPALVIVHPHAKWSEYGCPASLSSPFFDSDFVVTVSRGPVLDEQVVRAFPEREAWHYYPLDGEFVKVER